MLMKAIRLVREALLSYAIDPLTGKIDMDLIKLVRAPLYVKD